MNSIDSFKLTGKTALVTGGGVGLGAATAVAFGEAGAFVGIHYHSSKEGAAKVLDAVRKGGGDGMILGGDLTREADANAIVDQLVAKTGRLDILINNAGTLLGRYKIEEMPLEIWQKHFDLNITSAFIVTRRAIPHLRKTGAGRIVNILSLSIQTGGANGAGAYGASKGSLLVFTRTLARELAPQVRVNAICPGVIETRHHELNTTPERMAQYRKETPLGRNGKPEEVARTVLYLVSDASAFTTGAIIDVNGGRFLR
jgi:3-oxoacyl-[acyl-carrier protein] reductase